jgi:DNA ligase 1
MESDDSDATVELSDAGSDITVELSDSEIERMRADWQQQQQHHHQQQPKQQLKPCRSSDAALAPVDLTKQPELTPHTSPTLALWGGNYGEEAPSSAVQQLASILSVDSARASRLMALCGSVEAAIAHHFSGADRERSPSATRADEPTTAALPTSATSTPNVGAGFREHPTSGATTATTKRAKVSEQQHSITSFFCRGQAIGIGAKPIGAGVSPTAVHGNAAHGGSARAAPRAGPVGAADAQVSSDHTADTGSAVSRSGWGLERSEDRTAEGSTEPTRNARWMMAHRPDLAKPDQAERLTDGKELPLAAGEQKGQQQPLSTSIWEFNPSEYVSHWRGRAPYSLLAEAFSTLEGTTARTVSVATLTNAFRCLIIADRASLVPALYLCIDKIAPSYSADVAPIAVGHSILSKAIMEATGVQKSALREKSIAFGDLGDAAVAVKASQRTLSFGRAASKPLLIDGGDGQLGLFTSLQNISREHGSGAQERKRAIIAQLLVAAKGVETKYVVRTLEGQLRVGSAKKTILKALASAFALTLTTAQPLASNIQERKRLEAAMAAANTATQDCFAQHPNLADLCNAFWQIKEANGSNGANGSNVAASATACGPDVLDDVRCWGRLKLLCPLSAGVPVESMLGQITRNFDAMSARAVAGERFSCEWKYDGQRGQIHRMASGEVRIFSRHSQDTTQKMEEIAALFRDDTCSEDRLSRFPKSFVLDCEIVAVQIPEDEHAPLRLLPMQMMSTGGAASSNGAGRSLLPNIASQSNQRLCVFAFDLLVCEGDVLVDKPLIERRARLRRDFGPERGRFAFVDCEDIDAQSAVSDPERATGALQEQRPNGIDAEGEQEMGDRAAQVASHVSALCRAAVNAGCEGLMVKSLEGPTATYVPGARVATAWIKLKKDYLADGLADTLDVVPIAAFNGVGRKAGWLSPFLCAVYNEDSGCYEALSKCMSGFTDAQYKEFTASFKARALAARPPYYAVPESLAGAPFWFAPTTVWEIQGAELTVSPNYLAAFDMAVAERGLSLRFPRFLRVREDKEPEGCTSSAQLANMYRAQTRRGGGL